MNHLFTYLYNQVLTIHLGLETFLKIFEKMYNIKRTKCFNKLILVFDACCEDFFPKIDSFLSAYLNPFCLFVDSLKKKLMKPVFDNDRTV